MANVLIVDDTPALRTLAEALLQRLNLDTSVAENGRVALDMCQERMPDAVLLDWNMPVMDGPTFQASLRDLPGGDKVKVVFCTIESDLPQMKIAMNGGACEYIMKPFDIEILTSKLQLAGLIETPDAA